MVQFGYPGDSPVERMFSPVCLTKFLENFDCETEIFQAKANHLMNS